VEAKKIDLKDVFSQATGGRNADNTGKYKAELVFKNGLVVHYTITVTQVADNHREGDDDDSEEEVVTSTLGQGIQAFFMKESQVDNHIIKDEKVAQ